MKRCLMGQLFSVALLGLVAFLPASLGSSAEPPEGATENPTAPKTDELPDKRRGAGWTTLQGSWVASQFGGDGPVEITEDLIKIGLGDPFTGVSWKGEVFRENYELQLEARRNEGRDFFCGLTFPVGKDHVSFILGGWGGGVVGISSIDGYDASENTTTGFRDFKNNQWYKVRVRVTQDTIQCWIDDRQLVDHPREGHTFDIRFEMDPSVPLGVAAFECKSEVRGMRMRRLNDKARVDLGTELGDGESEQ